MKRRPSLGERLAADQFLIIHDPEATPEAIRGAISWIEASPHNRELYEAVDRFSHACEALRREAGSRRVSLPSRRPKWRATAVAAAWLVPLLLVGALAIVSFHPAGPPPIKTYAYRTSTGEVRGVRLADGSVMTLDADSRAIVAMGTSRDVRLLDGRAYFEVAHDPQRPFVVRTANGTVVALGTGFEVEQVDGKVVVTLSHGLVKVTALSPDGRSGEMVTLSPGEQVAYNSAGVFDKVHSADLDTCLAWQKGELYLENEPLKSVIVELNRYSPRKIILLDPTDNNIMLSGSLKVSGIMSWLYGLSRATNLEVIQGPDYILLRRRIAQPKSSSETAQNAT